MKRVATLLLNRNLPEVTDKLYNHIKRYDGNITDIYIIESGSNKNRLSKNYTWHANWPSAKKNGLRYFRGMNYGLKRLYDLKLFNKYEAFFLITNDAELEKKKTIEPLYNIMKKNKKIGIISPCSKEWGEKKFLKKQKTKFFWFIHNHAYFLNKEFLNRIINPKSGYMNFLFDGSNFRGYGLESELIAKAYANDFAAAITTSAYVEENENHLLNKHDLIKTETYSKNLQLLHKEGISWLKKKYGFGNKWLLQNYVKLFYDQFFENNPEQKRYKI